MGSCGGITHLCFKSWGPPGEAAGLAYKVGGEGGRRCGNEAEGNRDKKRREGDRDTLWKRMCPNPALVRRPVTCHPRPPGGRPSPRCPGAAPRGGLGQRWRERDGKRTHTPYITHIHNTHHTTHVIHTHHSHTNSTPSQHAPYTTHTSHTKHHLPHTQHIHTYHTPHTHHTHITQSHTSHHKHHTHTPHT